MPCCVIITLGTVTLWKPIFVCPGDTRKSYAVLKSYFWTLCTVQESVKFAKDKCWGLARLRLRIAFNGKLSVRLQTDDDYIDSLSQEFKFKLFTRIILLFKNIYKSPHLVLESRCLTYWLSSSSSLAVRILLTMTMISPMKMKASPTPSSRLQSAWTRHTLNK